MSEKALLVQALMRYLPVQGRWWIDPHEGGIAPTGKLA